MLMSNAGEVAAGETEPTTKVVTHGCRDFSRHEHVTHHTLARRIAALLGLEFAGAFDDVDGAASLYHVPRATLVGERSAAILRLADEESFFGGWVPHDFMATKAIMHSRFSGAAPAPAGWSDALGEAAEELTLRGYACFSAADAFAAGRELLRSGPVRVKPIHADGARGQAVLASPEELERHLASLRESSGALGDALVIEEDLDDAVTFSVGRARIGALEIAYYGTQGLTEDNRGDQVYGGSQLTVVAGGLDALLGQQLELQMRRAVECAMRFDALANAYLPRFIASRRNYDVVAGRAADGSSRLGVLDQSWRVGGASPAEIAALEALRDRPAKTAVCARTVERYGEQPEPPAGATVYFRGRDPVVGPLTKYAVVEEVTDAQQ